MKIVTQFRIALGVLALFAAVNAYAAFFIPNSRAIQAIASFLGLCVMVYIWIMTYRRMERPFAMINGCADQIAKGDLTAKITYSGNDELALFAGNINKMVGSVNAAIITVLTSANTIINTADVL